MRFAARLAVALGYADLAFAVEQDALLDALGLSELRFSADPEALLAHMKGDKKVRSASCVSCFPRDLAHGAFRCSTTISCLSTLPLGSVV